MPKSPWSPELDTLLQKYWNVEKYDATQISQTPAFRGLTRSAILGRVNRLRDRGMQLDRRKPLFRSVAPREPAWRPPAEPKPPRLPNLEEVPAPPPSPAPGSVPVPLMQLDDFGCRFVVSHDRPHLFCNADAHHPGARAGVWCYCDYHRPRMGRRYQEAANAG
jgi:hypothetical protein